MHPFPRAALAYFSWQAIEVNGSDELDAAIVAQDSGSTRYSNPHWFPCRWVAGRTKTNGAIEERLSRWYKSAAMACSRALLETNRVLDFPEKQYITNRKVSMLFWMFWLEIPSFLSIWLRTMEKLQIDIIGI